MKCVRILAAAAVTLLSLAAWGQVATTPATEKAARGARAIMEDLQTTAESMGENFTPTKFMTAAGRKEVGPKIQAPLTKMVALLDELMAVEPRAKPKMQGQKTLFLATLSALDDAAARKSLAAAADSKDADEALYGKLGQQMGAWIETNKEAAAQGQVVDAMTALAKDNPRSDALAQMLMIMKELGDVSPAVGQRIDAVFNDTLQGEFATQIKARLAKEAKQNAAVGKPVVLAGKSMDGKDFSSKDYAGKVVLVDFWATWCGPCRKELPRVKEMYQKYHDQGLEILGISCDGDGDELAKYVKDNEMPWVQLWDKAKQDGQDNAWHALATAWDVDGIPTMFLIDRAGVLRSVTARQTMEDLIPKLLAEKPAAAPGKGEGK